MRHHRAVLAGCGLFLAVASVSSCGSGTPSGGPTTTRPIPSSTSTPQLPKAVSPVTAQVSVSPDQGVAGTVLTFTVDIRGPGTLGGEGVAFGDGDTSGANAGDIRCGSTARADHTSAYTHAYAKPGTYRFSDRISIQSPPPSCAFEDITARVTVIAAAPLSQATLNGAFVSPSKNIACSIDETPPGSVRCATFSPPQLVTMDATGSFHTCSGRQCELGNPAMETPVLPYGAAAAGGPFQCVSSEAGMTCTVTGHRGFEISRSGVDAVS
jgi:hypothetical protein